MKKIVSMVLLVALVLGVCINATAEGKVVVYMPSPTGLADQLAEGFTAKTGIAVEQFQGTTGEILARLEAESANPLADVVILASWADGLNLQSEDKLLAYTPAQADKLYDFCVDAQGMLYGASASAVGVIYNTQLIPELHADWAELAGQAYQDQLAMPDPTLSGACKDFLAGYASANGLEASTALWQSLMDNGMSVPGANKAVLEAVVSGEKAIMVAGVDYNAYSSIAKGESLAIYYPASGTVINPRPAMILKTSPNTDNAKLFMDYLLSDEAQQLMADAYLLPGNSEIICEKRANVSEMPVIACDWAWMMENADSIAAQLVEMSK